MSRCLLKNNDGEYVKKIDRANKKLEFTKDGDEALSYPEGDWFATTELQYLKFHFKEHSDKLETMHYVYE